MHYINSVTPSAFNQAAMFLIKIIITVGLYYLVFSRNYIKSKFNIVRDGCSYIIWVFLVLFGVFSVLFIFRNSDFGLMITPLVFFIFILINDLSDIFKLKKFSSSVRGGIMIVFLILAVLSVWYIYRFVAMFVGITQSATG